MKTTYTIKGIDTICVGIEFYNTARINNRKVQDPDRSSAATAIRFGDYGILIGTGFNFQDVDRQLERARKEFKLDDLAQIPCPISDFVRQMLVSMSAGYFVSSYIGRLN